MAETVATHNNVEAVKYSDGSHHLHVKNAEGNRGKQIGSDDYLKQWGHDPSVRTSNSPTPVPIRVVEAPAEPSAALPAVAEGNGAAKQTADEMGAQADEVVARLDRVIPGKEQPPITEAERRFQTGQKIKVIKDTEQGAVTDDNWEVVDVVRKNNRGEIVYLVRSPDGSETREVSEPLLDNFQKAPEGKIDSIENQFNRLDERLAKRFEERLARIEARLGTELPTAVEKPKDDDEAPKEVKPAEEGKPEKREGVPQEFTLKGTDHNGQRYLLRGRTNGGPLQINRNIDESWNVIGGERGWFDIANLKNKVDLMNPPEAPEDKKLKIWTLNEGKEDGEELEIQEGDTSVIKMPDGSFNKEGKIKDIVEEDGKRYVIIAMPDGSEHKIDEENYLKGHIESGEFDEIEEQEKKEEDETAVIQEAAGDEELGPPQSGLKARWNQLRNWLKNKRGKARDAAVAAQVKAINKANGIKEPPDGGDEGLTKEQKERKHKCRRLAFLLGGVALGAAGATLAWWLTSKYGVNPFDNPTPKGTIPSPEQIPPTGPKNIPGGSPDTSGFHVESLEPYDAAGGSYNYYDAGTIWDHTIDDLQKQIGQRPTDAQIQRATQMVLDHNSLSWEQARHLPVGYKFEVPHRFPDWVLNGR